MSDSKFSVNQIDVEGLSNDPTMQSNLGGASTEYVDAKTVITWEVASQIGNGLTLLGQGASLAALNGTDIAYIDTATDALTTYRWDGTDWAQIGSSLAIATVLLPSISALNGTDIAFIDTTNDNLRTYRFGGSPLTWTQIGNGLTITGASNPRVAAFNGTDVAFIDVSSNDLRTYRFDGTDWAQIGNDLNITSPGGHRMTALNGTDIAFIDQTANLRTYRWDGTDWALVGNSLTITDAVHLALTTLNETTIAFIDSTNTELRTYNWDGTDWTQVGTGLIITGIGTALALTAINGTDVAFIDNLNDELRTYRFDGSVGYPAMVTIMDGRYISGSIDELSDVTLGSPITNEVLTFDGTNWVNADTQLPAAAWSDIIQIGNSLPVSGVGFRVLLTPLNATDVAYYDNGNDQLRTYRWDGTDWAQFGTVMPIPDNNINYQALTALNSGEVAFIKSIQNLLLTYTWDGSVWLLVSQDFLVSGNGQPAIAAYNNTDIVMVDTIHKTIRSYTWDGADWALSSNSTSLGIAGSMGNPAIAALNGTTAVFVDTVFKTLTTYSLVGPNWTKVGPGTPVNILDTPSITALNETDIMLTGANSDLQRYHFDGTDWIPVGTPEPITSAKAFVTALNETEIAFFTTLTDEMITYQVNLPIIGSADFTALLDDRYVNTTDLFSGLLALDDLSDVTITSPTVDQVLSFDGTNWLNSDSTVGNMVVDNFVGGVDYTAGTTTALTLSVTAATENNINVFFDGIVQHHSEYSLVGTTLTFTTAIPADTLDVEVVIGVTIPLNTPATDTVGTAQIQDGAVTAVKLADDYVNVTGDTMTGQLTINPAFPSLILDSSSANFSTVVFRDSSNAGVNRANITGGANQLQIQRRDTAGATQTSLELDTTGNVFVNGASPTAANHLTRKDYVDDNFVHEKVFTTSDTSNVDNTKFTKFATMTLATQYHFSDAILEVMASSGADPIPSAHKMHIRVKQQAAFGSDPELDCVLTSFEGCEGLLPPNVRMVVVQNTPTTIVDCYIQINSTYTTYYATKVSPNENGPHTEWLSAQPFVTAPGGTLFTHTITPNKTYVDDTTVALDGSRAMTGDLTHIPTTFIIHGDTDKTQRVIVAGGNGVSSTIGAYISLEGNDYGGVGLGGTLHLVAGTGKKVNVNSELSFSTHTTTDGHIQLYDGDAVDGYAIGVEPNTTFYRSGFNHRWYINTLADGGTSDYMQLTTTGLAVNGVVNCAGGTMTGTLTVSNLTPQIKLYESDAATNEKYWRLYASGTELRMDVHNDANTDARDIFVVTRTGINIDSFDIKTVATSTEAPTAATHLTRKDYVDTLHANRNVIINGNFDIWQRGATFTSIPNVTYSVDRFKYEKSGAMVHTVNRSTDVPTYAQSGIKSNYSLLLDVTTADASIAADDYTFISYRVEGYDYARLQGEDATLSFWVKGAKTGIHCVSFRNSIADRTYIREYTIATADTWQKVEVTVPLTETGGTWDYTNGSGLIIAFVLIAGTNFHNAADTWLSSNMLCTGSQVNECDNVANNFRIAQVQLERGSTATPFEYKSYADELARCHRYFEILEDGTSSFTLFGNLTATVATSARGWIGFSRKRTPAYSFSHTGNFTLVGAASNAVTALSVDSPSDSACRLVATVASGLVAGQSLYIAANSDNTARMYIDAEL